MASSDDERRMLMRQKDVNKDSPIYMTVAILGVPIKTIVNLRNRMGEERRRQTLCDKRDNNFV